MIVSQYLTHCRLNELPPLYILEDSNCNFKYVRLCDLHIPREKWLNYLQTVGTQIRLGIFAESGFFAESVSLLW